MAIRSFGNEETKLFYESGRVKKGVSWTSLRKIALRKLDMIDYAVDLLDLRSPPGNRLEKLVGSLEGYHSIRINDQWRIVFKWTDHGPEEVKI